MNLPPDPWEQWIAGRDVPAVIDEARQARLGRPSTPAGADLCAQADRFVASLPDPPARRTGPSEEEKRRRLALPDPGRRPRRRKGEAAPPPPPPDPDDLSAAELQAARQRLADKRAASEARARAADVAVFLEAAEAHAELARGQEDRAKAAEAAGDTPTADAWRREALETRTKEGARRASAAEIVEPDRETAG